MTALNKQALRVPERKRRDWSQAVIRAAGIGVKGE